MKNKTKKYLKRTISSGVAIILVVGLILQYSGDRIIRATELSPVEVENLNLADDDAEGSPTEDTVELVLPGDSGQPGSKGSRPGDRGGSSRHGDDRRPGGSGGTSSGTSSSDGEDVQEIEIGPSEDGDAGNVDEGEDGADATVEPVTTESGDQDVESSQAGSQDETQASETQEPDAQTSETDEDASSAPSGTEGSEQEASEGEELEADQPEAEEPEADQPEAEQPEAEQPEAEEPEAEEFDIEDVTYQDVPEGTGISLDSKDARFKDGSATLSFIGDAIQLSTVLSGIENDNIIVWKSSNPAVATVENGLVTAVKEGTAVIVARVNPEEDALYGKTFTAACTVNVQFESYDLLYHYALIPGASADVSGGDANSRWFGLGVTSVSGVQAPTAYTSGTILYSYIVGDAVGKPLYPDLTYNGVTYKYAATGTPEADMYGYYTLQPFRMKVENGANAGYNNYIPTTGVRTFHLDYVCVLNENSIYSVNFAVTYPASLSPETLTGYAQRVKAGSALSRISRPSASDVPATSTVDGITYQFDGWYTNPECTVQADFTKTVTSNITFYGRYIATNARYRVEYYYDGVLDDSMTVTGGPVTIGSVVSTYTEKAKSGFTFNEVVPTSLVVSADEDENVIRVYYKKRLEMPLSAISLTKVYDGTPLVAGVDSTLPEGTRVSYSTDGGKTWSATAPEITSPGVLAYQIRAEKEGYLTAYASGALKIEKRVVILTSTDATMEYNGSALSADSVSVTGDGFAAGEGATYSVTGSRTLVGISENAFAYELLAGTDAANYDIRTVYGKLTVTNRSARYEIEVSAVSGEVIYDGETHTLEGLTGTTFGVGGNIYTIEGLEARVSAVHAGTYPVAITGTPVVRDASGNDVTDQFRVVAKDGTLSIAKRTVSLRSADGVHTYDGAAFSVHEVVVGGDGFAAGEGAQYLFSGSRTVPGSSENSFAYVLVGADERDYDVSLAYGTLTVASRPEDAKYEVAVQAASGAFIYDGEEHAVSGITLRGATSAETQADGSIRFVLAGQAYTLAGLSASASAVNAGSYAVNVVGTPAVTDAAGNDVTSEFRILAASGTLEIAKRSVIITSASAERAYNGDALAADGVDVSGDGFAAGEGATYSVTGSRTLVGMSENAFTYELLAGTDAANYDIRTVFGKLTVTNRSARYEIEVSAASGEFTYDGEEHSVEGLTGTVFGIGGNVYTVEGLEAGASAVHAGTYPVAVTGTPVVRDAAGNDVTDQFRVVAKDGTLSIAKRTVSLRSADGIHTYDGTAFAVHEVIVGGDGFANDEEAAYLFSGSRTVAGSSENSFTYVLVNADEQDYDISLVYGTLTVASRPEDAKYELSVQAASGAFTYDGEEHAVSGITLRGATQTETQADGSIRFVLAGQTYTLAGLSAYVSAANAGVYAVNVIGTPVVLDAAGNDVTQEFRILTDSGTLDIAKRSVILTSASAERTYNGNALSADSVSVTGDGFAAGEGATYSVTGSRTLVGMSENAFTYELLAGTDAANYDIRTVFGKLTVLNRDAKYKVTLTPRSAEFLYDGTEHTVDGFFSTAFEVDGVTYTVEGLAAQATGVNAGVYDVAVTGSAIVRDPQGNDVSEEFAVAMESGTLTIRPRHITVTSGSSTAEYDGSPLQNSEYEIGGDGFADGESATFFSSSERTLVGASLHTFEWIFSDGVNEDNYVITPVYGTLNVVNRDAPYEITLRANSDEVRYDGSEHSVDGFETMEFNLEGGTYRVTGVEAGVSAVQAGVYTTQISGVATVLDADGADVTDQFAVYIEGGTLTIQSTDTLVIRYVDEAGEEVADPYRGTYDGGEPVSYIISPEINGMTPSFDVVTAQELPEGDTVVDVVYRPTDGDGSQPNDMIATVVQRDDGTVELEVIDENEVPLAPATAGYWALLNLILTILSVLGAALLLALAFSKGKRDEEDADRDGLGGSEAGALRADDAEGETEGDASEEDAESKRKRMFAWIGLVPAAASVIVFFLTENMANSMRLADGWTWLMLVLVAAVVLLGILQNRKPERKDAQSAK